MMQQSRSQTYIHILSLTHGKLAWLNTSEEATYQTSVSHELNSCWHVKLHALIPERTSNIQQYTTDIISFPFNNFKYYLTLFSKFFSSFPHGTCSLSVSCHYLALEGIYLPFRAALPSNSTRWKTVVHCGLLITNRALTFHDLLFQVSIYQGHNWQEIL